jgi:hypothetical protein
MNIPVISSNMYMLLLGLRYHLQSIKWWRDLYIWCWRASIVYLTSLFFQSIETLCVSREFAVSQHVYRQYIGHVRRFNELLLQAPSTIYFSYQKCTAPLCRWYSFKSIVLVLYVQSIIRRHTIPDRPTCLLYVCRGENT